MKVERKALKSISEFSAFKFVLVSYLIFFILFVIIFTIIGLIGWAVLSASGVTLAQVLNSLVPGLNFEQIIAGIGIGAGSSVLGIVLFIIVGLVASVFAAAIAALFVWIFNIVLKITGGIELRFAPEKFEKAFKAENAQAATPAGSVMQDYNINNQ